jgi:hypothetical protein
LQNPKRGFTLPLAAWLQTSLRDLMEDALSAVKQSGALERDGVDEIRDRFLREPASAAWSRVWALVALGAWLRSRARRPMPSPSR